MFKVKRRTLLLIAGMVWFIAGLPGGFNKITPKSNKELAERILSNKGLLMTEYAPDSDVSKYTYVERDAVIAAMSNGTLVMQCGVKSGTMHTVDAAYKMKRRIACYAGLINVDIFDGNKEMINSKDSAGIESETDLEEFVKKSVEWFIRRWPVCPDDAVLKRN